MAKNDKGRPPGGPQAQFGSSGSREFHRTLERKAHKLAELFCSSGDIDFPFDQLLDDLSQVFLKQAKRLALAEWCLAKKRLSEQGYRYGAYGSGRTQR